MRLFLLPISTRQALIYCQRSSTQKPIGQLSYADRITKKATETWAKWEEAKDGWRATVIKYGNQGLQRIPYQEWGLKSFPPSNPKLQAELVTKNEKFDISFPSNVMRKEDVSKMMSRLARERKTLHWNRFVGSAIAMPFTAPFALVPVIPNIPFFYAAYRCWSHWRALKGSDHLDFIVDHRLFKPISPPELEKIYEDQAPDAPDFTFVTQNQILDETAPKEEMILTAQSHTVLAKVLGVPELSGEIERAVRQVQQKLKKEEEESQQEQKKLTDQAKASETEKKE